MSALVRLYRRKLSHWWRERRAWREADRRTRWQHSEHRPCPLCGGHMTSYVPTAELHTATEPRLTWRRCGACQRHQEGVPA